MATQKKTAEVDYSMQEKILALYDLQKIDSQIDSINKVKGELPLEVQDLDDELAGLKARVENINAEIEELNAKQAELQSIEAETASQVAEFTDQAAKAQAKIDERLLEAYQRIRRNVRNGLAVVTVRRDACGGCFNRIPPQRQMEIRQGKKIIICEYCGRILVADPEEQQ